jgi:hypothetical protein
VTEFLYLFHFFDRDWEVLQVLNNLVLPPIHIGEREEEKTKIWAKKKEKTAYTHPLFWQLLFSLPLFLRNSQMQP